MRRKEKKEKHCVVCVTVRMITDIFLAILDIRNVLIKVETV